MLHIPILRKGVPYKSLDVIKTPHHRTRETYVEISQANVGLIRRDLLDQRTAREALGKFSTAQLIDISRRAADIFLNDTLAVGDASQTPDQYVEQLSATTGMPYTLVRRNMKKIHAALAEMEAVIAGLTRRIPYDVLDRGVWGGAELFPLRTDSLGIVLPSNSPGVHSLWTPAFALKIPLILKPGSAEPWTPYRLIQALLQAGAPPAAFSYYPADHAAGAEILRQCGRGMVFGDVGSTKIWANDPRVEVHGPGFSKVVIGEDCADEWEKYLDVMVTSISANSGAIVRERVGGVDASAWAEDPRRRWRRRLSKIVPARGRRSSGGVVAVRGRRRGVEDFENDRRGYGRGSRCIGGVEGSGAMRGARRVHVLTADDCGVRDGSSAGESRIPVPVCQRGGGSTGFVAGGARVVASSDGSDE